MNRPFRRTKVSVLLLAHNGFHHVDYRCGAVSKKFSYLPSAEERKLSCPLDGPSRSLKNNTELLLYVVSTSDNRPYGMALPGTADRRPHEVFPANRQRAEYAMVGVCLIRLLVGKKVLRIYVLFSVNAEDTGFRL